MGISLPDNRSQSMHVQKLYSTNLHSMLEKTRSRTLERVPARISPSAGSERPNRVQLGIPGQWTHQASDEMQWLFFPSSVFALKMVRPGLAVLREQSHEALMISMRTDSFASGDSENVP